MRNNVFRGRPISEKPQERQAANRPDYVDKIPRRVLFSVQGSTGWGRVRDLRDYKGNRSEQNFSDQHHKFTEEEA